MSSKTKHMVCVVCGSPLTYKSNLGLFVCTDDSCEASEKSITAAKARLGF